MVEFLQKCLRKEKENYWILKNNSWKRMARFRIINPPCAKPLFCVQRRCKANVDLAVCPIQLHPMFAPCRPEKLGFSRPAFSGGSSGPPCPSRMKRLDRPSSSNYGRGYPYGGFRQAAPGFPSCTTSEAATGVSDFPGMAGFFPARARKRDPQFAALHQTPFQAIVHRTPCGMHAPARKSGPMTRLLQITSRATRRISHAARSCTRIAHASQRLPSICRSP